MFSHGNREENKIALTFDDGPSEETEQVLDILKKYNIKATFFIVGKMISGREHIIERCKREGHDFGNHTYSHKRLWFKSKKFTRNEILQCDKALKEVGIQTNLFRFPGFRYDFNSLRVCRELGRKVIFGTPFFDWVSYDWFNLWFKRRKDIRGQNKINFVVRKTLSGTRNGTVLIFHDYLQEIGPNKELIEILEQVIPKLREKYEFITLRELLLSR